MHVYIGLGMQGDACEDMGDEYGYYYPWIVLTTSVTCAALLYDIVNRYVFAKHEDKKPLPDATADNSVDSKQKNKQKEEEEKLLAETRAAVDDLKAAKNDMKDEADAIIRAAQRMLLEQAEQAPQQQAVSKDEVDGGQDEGDGAVRDLLEDLASVLRRGVDGRGAVEDEAECRQHLDTIAALQRPCNSLAVAFAKCAMDMSHHQEGEEAPEAEQEQEKQQQEAPEAEQQQQQGHSPADLQSRSRQLSREWSGIRRLLFCVDVQLKNASNYHQFFHDVDQLKKAVEEVNTSMTATLGNEVKPVKDFDELKAFDNTVQDSLKILKVWNAWLSRLAEQSKDILPLHLRTEPVTDPITAHALCSYTGSDLSVSEGDMLNLLDNEDDFEWQVETVSGAQGKVPALCCVIPGPDPTTAKELSEVRQGMLEAYVTCKIQFQRRLLVAGKDIIGDILKTKKHCIETLLPDRKKSVLDSVESLKTSFGTHYSADDEWPELEKLMQELQGAVEAAKEDGVEAECLEEVMDMLARLNSLCTSYKSLLTNMETHSTLRFGLAGEQLANGEWDTLEDLEQAKREMTLGVSVKRERTQIGQASTYESASSESSSTFSISGVLDPRNFAEISMDDAIKRGIVDKTRGVYINFKTNEEIPIPVAMNQGFIIVESTKTRKTRELKKAIGMVTVKVTRETRPYSVKAILDPRTDKELTVSEAVEQGVFDPKRERWCNPDTDEEMTVENAIDCGGFIVEYDAEAEVSEPEVSEKTFVVFGVLDRKSGKRLPFYEAAEKGLIDKEEGIYTDTSTGEKMHVVEAFKKKYVRARVIEDPKQLEFYLSEGLPRSRDSSASSET